MSIQQFDPKDPAEIVPLTFDFSNLALLNRAFIIIPKSMASTILPSGAPN